MLSVAGRSHHPCPNMSDQPRRPVGLEVGVESYAEDQLPLWPESTLQNQGALGIHVAAAGCWASRVSNRCGLRWHL